MKTVPTNTTAYAEAQLLLSLLEQPGTDPLALVAVWGDTVEMGPALPRPDGRRGSERGVWLRRTTLIPEMILLGRIRYFSNGAKPRFIAAS